MDFRLLGSVFSRRAHDIARDAQLRMYASPTVIPIADIAFFLNEAIRCGYGITTVFAAAAHQARLISRLCSADR